MGSNSDTPFNTSHNIINGQLRGSETTTYGINPFTQKQLWSVPDASRHDVDEAVTTANDAFCIWSKHSINYRKERLGRLRDLYTQNIDRLIQLLILEAGKPLPTARAEAHGALDLFDHHLSLSLPEDSWEDKEKIVSTRYVPLGVVAAICPWNFPIILSLGKIIPALLTGCCIIVKPSPYTPYTTLKIVEIAQQIFPPGVVQAVAGGENIGPVLVAHPKVHKISFTGSIATGKKIMATAAGTLKRVTLELGGNDASIICPDVDIMKVAPEVVQGCFINSGQVCVATKRVYIHEDIYDKFLKAMTDTAKRLKVGSASIETSDLGPIQNLAQYNRVKDLSQDCTSAGFKFALGPQKIEDGEGFYIKPAIIDNPPDSARIVTEEPFGPIVPTLKWKDESDVILRANNSNTGLAACVWSSDLTRAEKIAHQLQAGSVFINSWEKTTPQAHFCGHKESGIGGEWGKLGILHYCNVQVIHKYK